MDFVRNQPNNPNKKLSQKPGRKKTKSKEVKKSVTQLTDKGAKNGTLVSKGRLEWEKNSSLQSTAGVEATCIF